MKSRIRKIINEKNLTNSEFSEQTGIPKSGLSHILSGRNKVSLDYVLKILKAFPEIDTDWLLTGEGNSEKLNHEFLEKKDNIDKRVSVTESTIKTKIDKQNKEKDKTIEKVIIFYNDNTFKVYKES